MKFIIFGLILFSFVPDLKAENKWYFTFGGWSYHTSARDYKFDFERISNETHNPIGYEYEVDQKRTIYSFEGITFNNSYYIQSNAFCTSYQFKYRYGNIGGKSCISTGYKKRIFKLDDEERTINNVESEYVFYIFPVYSFKIKSLKFELSYSPKGDENKDSTDVFMLTTKIELNQDLPSFQRRYMYD